MPFAKIESKTIYYTFTPASSTVPAPFTVVFIHGLGSSSSFYFPIIPQLTSLGYPCLTLDTHGSGASPYTGSGNSISSIKDDVLAVLDTLPTVQDVVIVGHSMGCIVASELALSRLRERMKGVVLIGPVNPNPEAADIFNKRIGVVEKDGMEAMATTIPTAATGSNATPLVHAFIRQLLISTDTNGYVSLCRAIAEAPVPDYSRIQAPMLILAGEEDNSAPLEGCKKILAEYGSVKKDLNVLSSVGHWHVLEAPGEVAPIIAEYLKGL